MALALIECGMKYEDAVQFIRQYVCSLFLYFTVRGCSVFTKIYYLFKEFDAKQTHGMQILKMRKCVCRLKNEVVNG